MLRNLIEKLRAKFPATYICGYSMAKIALLDDAFLLVFEWEASPVEVQSLKQKDKERTKRKGKKSPKTSQFFYSVHARAKMLWDATLVERKGCCHVANALLGRLELIWPISSLKISKLSKIRFLAKSSGS